MSTGDFEYQLEQVEASIKASPGDANLIKLAEDLKELIALTKQSSALQEVNNNTFVYNDQWREDGNHCLFVRILLSDKD